MSHPTPCHQMLSLESGSMKLGVALPAGCQLCREGAKMVLLVTGLCGKGCFYCPLSWKKRDRDVVYANELLIGEISGELLTGAQLDAVEEEARSIDAEGTGITGGDPFLVSARTVQIIEMLKGRFGKEHHIHLYTACSGKEPVDTVKRFAAAGLDEIRFHILQMPTTDVESPDKSEDRERGTNNPGENLSTVLECIEAARLAGMDTGVEIPMLPGNDTTVLEIIPTLVQAGAQFLNLNELEFSETNFKALMAVGYDVRDDISSAAAGSRETAGRLLGDLAAFPHPGTDASDLPAALTDRSDHQAALFSLPENFTIHFCSSSYKDAVQLRKRILRRARHVATKACEVTEEGLLVKGVIEFTGTPQAVLPGEKMLAAVMDALANEYDIPPEFLAIDIERNRVEIAPFILEDIVPVIREDGLPPIEIPASDGSIMTIGPQDMKFAIVEEYPTADRLEVERQYL